MTLPRTSCIDASSHLTALRQLREKADSVETCEGAGALLRQAWTEGEPIAKAEIAAQQNLQDAFDAAKQSGKALATQTRRELRKEASGLGKLKPFLRQGRAAKEAAIEQQVAPEKAALREAQTRSDSAYDLLNAIADRRDELIVRHAQTSGEPRVVGTRSEPSDMPWADDLVPLAKHWGLEVVSDHSGVGGTYGSSDERTVRVVGPQTTVRQWLANQGEPSRLSSRLDEDPKVWFPRYLHPRRD